ncbi:MAG: aminotransferase class I/II-fold pyridoxal phosphate-dependent enzyme, partial [Cyanobacteria bacterium P01_D01_bin.116]
NLICPPVVSQYAALGALQAQPEYLKDNIQAIAEVRELVIEAFQGLEDICTIAPADGAFYFFLKVHNQMDAFELVKQLISIYHVAVLPGTTFGMNQGCYLRVAYGALQKEAVKEGIERLVNGLKDLVSC